MSKKVQASAMENILVSESHQALYNKIAYLKKQIHLVEGERKASYESNEAFIKKSDKVIKEVQKKNVMLKQKQKYIVDSKSSYFKKIAKVLGGEKMAYEFKDKGFREVIDILECKIGASRNKLNMLKFKRKNYTEAMSMSDTLHPEGNLRRRITKKNIHCDSRLGELKTTEASTAAMQLKKTEAENVRASYKHMYGVLKDKNFTQSIRITDLESVIEKQKKEIVLTQIILLDANKARKSAKAHLKTIEEETVQEYSRREQELYEARMNLKMIRDKMESVEAKFSYHKFNIISIHRDSPVTEGLLPTPSAKLDHIEGPESLSNIEAVHHELQELTGESDPKLLIEQFEKQRCHTKKLVRDEQAMKSAVRKAKLRRYFLADKLGKFQYSGGLIWEELNEKSDKISDEITSATTERLILDNIMHEFTVMMAQMLSKLTEICQNNDLRLPNMASNDAQMGPGILVILKYVIDRTEQVVLEQTVMTTTSLLSPLPARRNTTASIWVDDDRFSGGELSQTRRFGSTGEISLFPGIAENTSGIGSRRPSVADVSMFDISQMGKLTVDGIENDIFAVSPLSHSTGFLLQVHIPESDAQEENEKPAEESQFAFMKRDQDSSEEEEAVSRNFVKRQSLVLLEAKARKERFNPGTRHRFGHST